MLSPVTFALAVATQLNVEAAEAVRGKFKVASLHIVGIVLALVIVGGVQLEVQVTFADQPA